MHYVRQHRSVHLFVFGPVGAVHVRHVEIVALVAPTFIEDLLELFFRIEIHAEVNVETAGTRLWRRSICIDDKKRRSRGPATKGRRTAAASTAGRAIDEFVTVRAHFIGGNPGNKRRRAAIAKAIANQLAATTTTAAALSTRRRFQVENDSVRPGM